MPRFDRISELPESLITEILLHLPTKDSVKTSVLSTRWKNLWLHVPGIDLNCRDFPFKNQNELEMVSFIDRFLQFNPESRLQKFKVDYRLYSRDQILQFKDRIADAVSRGIRVLDVKSNTLYQDADDGLVYPCIEFMPLNLYTSKTLVSLKLSCSGLWDPDEGSVYMPCLRFMHLHEVRWRSSTGGIMNLEMLVSGCPVLEELTYVKDNYDDELVVTRVRSRSLKRFSVPVEYEIFNDPGLEAQTLEIDAPGLEYMSLKEDHFDRVVVKNLTSLFMVDLDIKFIVKRGQMFDPEDLSKRNEIRDFLTGISRVRHMIISHQTVKVFELYSKVGLIPKFNNLSHLHAAFTSSLQFLPAFLESLPNLKHLILESPYSNEKTEVFKRVNVPQCLVTALECVEVKELFDWGEEEMNIASYFLENSAVLKKLSLSFFGCPQHYSETEIYEELNNLTKCSPRCQIITV